MDKGLLVAVGMRIRMARRDMGLTQEEFAEELGVSRTTVAHWERGKHGPDLSMLLRLAIFCGKRTDEFIFGGETDLRPTGCRRDPVKGCALCLPALRVRCRELNALVRGQSEAVAVWVTGPRSAQAGASQAS